MIYDIIGHLAKVQSSAGKHMGLALMWMSLDTNQLLQTPLKTKHTPSSQQDTLMTSARPKVLQPLKLPEKNVTNSINCLKILQILSFSSRLFHRFFILTFSFHTPRILCVSFFFFFLSLSLFVRVGCSQIYWYQHKKKDRI